MLTSSVASMRTSHEQLLQQLNDASAKVEAASDVIQTLSGEKEELKQLVAAQETLASKLKLQCERKTSECEQLSQTLTDLEESLTSFEERITSYKQNVLDLTEGCVPVRTYM